MNASVDHWSDRVFKLLKGHGISLVATVPDAGLTKLLDLCRADAGVRVITLSSEEEGVGLSVGAWLGHGRALLCMQSSGVGNCINALALPAATGAPCLMLVTMRGEADETNPWQVPMGRAVRSVLAAMNVALFEADTARQVGMCFDQAAHLVFGEGRAAAVLIRQSVLGVKRFDG
jgi:sulfopyruvate decarboxylase alpha subunit